MQNTSSLVSSIFKSRETLIKLMETQGYNTSEYENISLTETNAKYTNNQLDMLFDTPSDGDLQIRKTYVNYHIDKALRPAYIHDIIEDLFNVEELLTKNDTLVLVTKDDPHDTIINTLKHLWEKDGYFVIIHHIKRLQFNILDHNLVPSHRLLKDNEITETKTKYNITHSNQFPDISRFDPVALAIGMRPGEVCEIIRPSKTSITGVYYRVCV
jgi:DNA-directed RNA polymerase subunit H (RpoH/RPB5)